MTSALRAEAAGLVLSQMRAGGGGSCVLVQLVGCGGKKQGKLIGRLRAQLHAS